jgi:SWIB/MDM2 domain
LPHHLTSREKQAFIVFMKPMQPSEQLAQIVGAEPLPRSEVTKKIWAHIKKQKLQNPKNMREILADDKLQPIFGAKKFGHVSDDQGGQQAPEVSTSSQRRGAISLKFKKDTYPAIEVLFVVSCLPSAQHGFKLLPRNLSASCARGRFR